MNATVKVGIFMFVVLILAGVLILKIEDLPFGKGRVARKVEVVFDTVAGLDEKSAVRVAGIRVGKVDRILLEGSHARAILRIDDPRVELHKGASARIVAMGLLGDKYIELSPGPMNAELLPEGGVLGGAVPVGIDQLETVAAEIGANLKTVSASMKKALGGEEGEARMIRIVENIKEITDSLRDVLRQKRGNIDATAENFAAFSTDLRREVPKIAEQIRVLSEKLNAVVDENRGGMKDGISNVKTLAEKLQTSADNLNAITTKIASGEGTIGKLVNDDDTHDKLTKALDSVSDGVNTLTKALGKVGNTRFDLGFEGAYLSATENSRTAFTMDVTPQDSRRFYKLDVVSIPDGKRNEKTETTTTIFPDGHSETWTTTKTKWEDAWGITANVGWKATEDLSVRAGIIEGRGGVAADYDTLGKKIRLSVEAFDFARHGTSTDPDPNGSRKAHLRLTGRYRFNDNLFLVGGYDDPLMPENRSVFFGGGINWVDEDIKYLMGSVPIK